MRSGKDDVVVFGIQFPRLNGIEPFLAFEPPAVGAVAICAGGVQDAFARTRLAIKDAGSVFPRSAA